MENHRERYLEVKALSEEPLVVGKRDFVERIITFLKLELNYEGETLTIIV
jgi:hypothetical protein